MSKEWDIVIERKSNLFNLDFKEVWRYKDLLFMYVKRDIVTLYKQTILGSLWFIIQPVLTTIMFMFVFGGIAGISTDGVPQDSDPSNRADNPQVTPKAMNPAGA